MPELIDVPPGLAGVAVADTEIGEQGYYHYRGIPAPRLAREADFETAAALVLGGSADRLQGDRSLPTPLAALVGSIDVRTGLSALGGALSLAPLPDTPAEQRLQQAVRLIAVSPTLVASILHRRPIEPDPDLGHVADFLRMVLGTAASSEVVRALETYFVLTIDHGFNNSTFATRVAASAGADLAGCVTAGYSSLSGKRHGADTERILDMFDAIDEPDRAEGWLRNEMAERRRIQGFGHSVYRRQDPRVELLREIGAVLAPERHRMAVAVEEAGTRLLAGRRLVPNLDLHAAVVLEGCGIPRGWFTATFGAARIVGWCAHALEQVEDPKIYRPAARYVGPPPQDDIY